MKKNLKIISGMLLACLCVLASVMSVAAQQEPPQTPPKEDLRRSFRRNLQQRQLHPLQKLLAQNMAFVQRLDLTDEQRAQLRVLVMRRANEWQALNFQTRQARNAYNRILLGAETATPEMLEQRSRALGRVEAEWARIVGEVWGEVRQILTPEQFARFRQMREEQMKRRALQALPSDDDMPIKPNDMPRQRQDRLPLAKKP